MEFIMPGYYARNTEKGWQVVWHSPTDEEMVVENGKVYPQRQNAYRRAKQLNDEAKGPPRRIYVRVVAKRADCETICKKIQEIIDRAYIVVIDPMFSDIQDDTRYITFPYKVRLESEGPQERYGKRVLTHDEFYAWLDALREEFHVYVEREHSPHILTELP